MTVTEKEGFLSVAGHQIDTTLFTPAGIAKHKVLFLHGAGESSKDRFTQLANSVAAKGNQCLTFSSPGHGKSSGTLEGQTLKDREEITHQVARHFGFWPADLAVAVSMGAHTAMSLLKRDANAFKRLVLMVPATYSYRAQHIAFGPDFSAILRTPGSFRESKAVVNLAKFKGPVALVQAGKDQVIPAEIYDMIHAQIASKGQKQHIVFEDSAHQVTKWLAEQEYRIESMAHALDTFDFSGLKELS